MTTALTPVNPTVSPQQAARVLTIRADLLPPEIKESRRSRVTRTMVVILMVATLAVLGAWYAQATIAKQNAEDDYNETFQALTSARAAQKTEDLKALVEYQDGGTALNAELTTVMASDLSWTNLVSLIRDRAADTDVTISRIDAGLSTTPTATGSEEATEIGSVTITGNAENKRVVADFVNEFGNLKDMVNPFVTSVTNAEGGVTFTVTIAVTREALCGRFTKTCPSGGK